jgi:hypothetical protein
MERYEVVALGQKPAVLHLEVRLDQQAGFLRGTHREDHLLAETDHFSVHDWTCSVATLEGIAVRPQELP